MDRATGLADAYKAILSLPESPYGRVFRQGVNFFSELRPGALREGAPPSEGLSLTQLQALKLVLEKVEAEERDELGEGLTWLAVLGSVSPLLGLMGTVLGITTTFLGITASGSTNIVENSMSRCSWVMVGPSVDGSTGPVTVCAMPDSADLANGLPPRCPAATAARTGQG
jgi:hypothetical protein